MRQVIIMGRVPPNPTFTYAAAACGNSVSASVNYVMNLALKTVTIPITAKACFPLNIGS